MCAEFQPNSRRLRLFQHKHFRAFRDGLHNAQCCKGSNDGSNDAEVLPGPISTMSLAKGYEILHIAPRTRCSIRTSWPGA